MFGRRRGMGRGGRGVISSTFFHIIRIAIVLLVVCALFYIGAAKIGGDRIAKDTDNFWDKGITVLNSALDGDIDFQKIPDAIIHYGDFVEKQGKEKVDQAKNGDYNLNFDKPDAPGAKQGGGSSDTDAGKGRVDVKGKSKDVAASMSKSIDVLKKNVKDDYKPGEKYNREKQFKTWLPVTNKNAIGYDTKKYAGCNVRQAIVRQTGKSVVLKPGKCSPKSGVWTDAYGYRDKSGKVIYEKTTDSSKFDLDHIVPVSEAWKSGADKMDDDTRQKIANDRTNLVLAGAHTNRSKGDQRIDQWTPPKDSKFYCSYGERYAKIKATYGLYVKKSELKKLEEIESECSVK